MSLAAVKELRSISGAPMMECKKALDESAGDLDKAMDWLRKKGVANAAKRADNATAEGFVGIKVENGVGSIIQLTSETDFVARNELFQALVLDIVNAAHTDGTTNDAYTETCLSLPMEEYPTVADAVTGLVAKVRENIILSKANNLVVENGTIGSYVHGALTGAGNVGTAGALVALETSTADYDADAKAVLEETAKKIAMHIVAAKPSFLDQASTPQEAMDKEKAILTEQALASGKAPEFVEKMVNGRMGKYYSEVCLLEQAHLIEEGTPKVKKVLAGVSKQLGFDVNVIGFELMSKGE
jgi:elongation factor Ts